MFLFLNTKKNTLVPTFISYFTKLARNAFMYIQTRASLHTTSKIGFFFFFFAYEMSCLVRKSSVEMLIHIDNIFGSCLKCVNCFSEVKKKSTRNLTDLSCHSK